MNTFGFAVVLLAFCGPAAHAQWRPQALATDANLRGLSAVSPTTAWVSGTRGTFGRTTDGGKTWAVGTVAGAEKLDFRDVEAFGDATAYLLSAGPGGDSRIYKTTDGGKTWALRCTNPDPDGFYDALAFWDDKTGLALGDPVKGRFQLLRTDDGGATWRPLPAADLPPALSGEGAFAASGTCLVTHGDKYVWFATGGAKVSRVFRSADRGRTWAVAETPVAAGADSAGVFSVAFRDADHGVIVGGDYRKPESAGATAAVTADGGKTWAAADKTLPYRSGVAWARDRWVAVGPSGSHVSLDDGATWKPLDAGAYNSVAFTSAGDGWAAGPKGRVAAFEKPARRAAERGLDFLQKDAARWRADRECATCHHGTMTVWALAEAKGRGYGVAADAHADAVKWTKDRLLARIDLPRDERPGWSMVNTPALYLSLMAAGVPAQDAVTADELKRIAGHLVRHQEADGSWAWSSAPAKNRPPPVFESDEVATLFGYLALGPQVPADPKVTSEARDAREKAAAWLAKAPPTDTTQAAALRLLVTARSKAEAKALGAAVDRFLARRSADGGWGQLPGSPSDAYATGQALYVLSLAGVGTDREEVRRAVTFLVATQKDDGSWPMKRRGHPGVTPSDNIVPITYFGTAWATLGLMRSAPR